MATTVKFWRHIENPTSSINAFLLAEHSHQISYPSDLKRCSLRLFWKVSPKNNKKKNKKNNNKMSSEMRSVPDPKMETIIILTLFLSSSRWLWNSARASASRSSKHWSIAYMMSCSSCTSRLCWAQISDRSVSNSVINVVCSSQNSSRSCSMRWRCKSTTTNHSLHRRKKR